MSALKWTGGRDALRRKPDQAKPPPTPSLPFIDPLHYAREGLGSEVHGTWGKKVNVILENSTSLPPVICITTVMVRWWRAPAPIEHKRGRPGYLKSVRDRRDLGID